jgi:hypothetical protein
MYFMLWILCNFASFKGKQKVIKKEKRKKKTEKKGKGTKSEWRMLMCTCPAQLQRYQQFFPRHRTYVK